MIYLWFCCVFIGGWAWILNNINRTCNQRLDLLNKLKDNDYRFHEDIFSDVEHIPFERHLWQLVTFRNPWEIYSARSQWYMRKDKRESW